MLKHCVELARHYLLWIVALMVYLAALAVAGAFALGESAVLRQSGHSDRLTVQLPPPDKTSINNRTDRVVEMLRITPGVSAVRRLDRSELIGLLDSWLTKETITPDLPLPEIIDVIVVPGVELDLAALKNSLEKAAPGVRLDDHNRWIGRLVTAARSVQALALMLVALIAGAATATVAVTARAGLAVHRETIEILHLIGAEDGYILRTFGRRALWSSLRGGLIGIGLAALTLVFLQRTVSGIEAPLMPRLDFPPLSLAVLAALPLVSIAITMITVRFTVLRSLEKLP